MHHANKKKERRKKCPRTGVYSDKGRLPGSTFFPAREELVGVLLSENPSIHYDIYTSTYIQSTPKALWYTGVLYNMYSQTSVSRSRWGLVKNFRDIRVYRDINSKILKVY